jgi:hypothetical protein
MLLWLLTTPVWAQEWTTPAVERHVAAPAPEAPAGWETIHAPWLRLHAPPGHTALLLQLARHASTALPALSERLGVPVTDTIHVFVAEDDASFRSLQAGRVPVWADATAVPERSTVFLRAPGARAGTDRPLEVVFTHELVHVLLGRAFLPGEPPSWLQEGLARSLAGEVAPTDAARLAGTPPTLTALTHGFPIDHRGAEEAYIASADFLAYVAERGGPGAWQRLVDALVRQRPIEEAVLAASGAPLDEVEAAWRRRHLDAPRVSWMNTDVLLGAGGLALVAGGVLRRRRLKRRLAELEAQDEAAPSG